MRRVQLPDVMDKKTGKTCLHKFLNLPETDEELKQFNPQALPGDGKVNYDQYKAYLKTLGITKDVTGKDL